MGQVDDWLAQAAARLRLPDRPARSRVAGSAPRRRQRGKLRQRCPPGGPRDRAPSPDRVLRHRLLAVPRCQLARPSSWRSGQIVAPGLTWRLGKRRRRGVTRSPPARALARATFTDHSAGQSALMSAGIASHPGAGPDSACTAPTSCACTATSDRAHRYRAGRAGCRARPDSRTAGHPGLQASLLGT